MSKHEAGKKVPINELLKSVLLQIKVTQPWIEQLRADLSLELTGDYPHDPTPEKKVFQELWVFRDLTEDQFRKLSKRQLSNKLRMLETQDQDGLVRGIPEREKDFWSFIERK